MARRESLVTVLDFRDPIIGVDPATGRQMQWDWATKKWVPISDDMRGKDVDPELLEQILDQQSYFERAVSRGSTDIDGGFVVSNLLAVRDVPSEKTTYTAIKMYSKDYINMPGFKQRVNITTEYQRTKRRTAPIDEGWTTTRPALTATFSNLYVRVTLKQYNDSIFQHEESVTIEVGEYIANNAITAVTPQLNFSADPTNFAAASSYTSSSIFTGRPKLKVRVDYATAWRGAVRGYMSGFNSPDVPFLGAGVQHFRGLDGEEEFRIVEVFHDGRFRFAGLAFNPANGGMLELYDFVDEAMTKLAPDPYMVFGGTPPRMSDFKSEVGIVPIQHNSTYSTSYSSSKVVSGIITITNDGAEATIEATLSASANAYGAEFAEPDDPSKPEPMMGVHTMTSLYLRNRSTGWKYSIGHVSASATPKKVCRVIQNPDTGGGGYIGGSGQKTSQQCWYESDYNSRESKVRNTIRNLSQGTYELLVEVTITKSEKGRGSGQGAFNGASGNAYNRPNHERIHYHRDGLSIAYDGGKKLFWINKNPDLSKDESFLTTYGSTDTPGVLCAGRVSSIGGVVTAWGAKKGHSVSRSGGTYIVYHNIGHSNYIVQVTPEGSYDYRAMYHSITNSSFKVTIRNASGTESSNGFSYTCYGDNM